MMTEYTFCFLFVNKLLRIRLLPVAVVFFWPGLCRRCFNGNISFYDVTVYDCMSLFYDWRNDIFLNVYKFLLGAIVSTRTHDELQHSYYCLLIPTEPKPWSLVCHNYESVR